MNNLKNLETQYLDAKIAYYSGKPTMTDSEFDALESNLKSKGSVVIRQVGMKRDEFDYPHPTPMLSLNKIQTEAIPNSEEINFHTDDLLEWATKKCKILGINVNAILFEWSPKYDGNAINAIYVNGKLNKILSRSDKDYGKDATEKIKSQFLQELPNIPLYKSDIYEIRFEGVMKTEVFEKKYSNLGYENPRNMVAGLLGRDEVVKEDLNDIEFKAVCALKDGKYTFIYNNEFFTNYLSEYENIIQQWTNQRDLFPYPIDGIVISFPLEYRDKLGVNDHDPEWSIAIKFVPEEATTTIEDIIWQVGKTGSVTPVGILKPVKLSGATVKRVSLYNAGNVIEKKLGIGAVISIHRAGDIIPEISKLIVPSENEITLPNQCPACGSALEFDGVTLYCTNFSCKAKLIRLLDHHLKLLKIKHVGRATIDSFADQGFTIIDLICFVRQFGNDKEKIEPFGFNHGSRSHEIFLNAFNSIKEIDYSLIPVFLGINNVGKKLAKLVSLFYNGTEVDWKHQERALVDLFTRPETKASINNVVERLESVGIEIIYPIEVSDKKVVRAELTGSPKPRWKTKEEFRAECNVVEASLSDDNCDYLITDDYNSNSGKMVTAKKKGITIITYEDFAKMGI